MTGIPRGRQQPPPGLSPGTSARYGAAVSEPEPQPQPQPEQDIEGHGHHVAVDEAFQASLRVDGPRMVQTLEGKDHTLSLAYSLRPEEDTLALQVTYTHPKLANPFSYKLVYRRKG